MNNIELQELAGGGLQENFQKAFEEIIKNMQDSNTPWKNKRAITMKIAFTQNESRDDATCEISVEKKLAPVKPIETRMSIGKDLDSGDVFAEEYGKQIRGQMNIADMQEPVQEIDGKAVDTATGEILERNDKIIDFKSKQAQEA